MQKQQCFIIGTGRNGSKLLADLLSQGTNISKFGEVGRSGPIPFFYRDAYENGMTNTKKLLWKNTRRLRMVNCKEIYLEKNHLIVPILSTVEECFPDAKFIWLKRDIEDTKRSFMNRPTYEESEMSGSYGQGRLVPKEESFFYSGWGNLTKEGKVQWLVNEYHNLCAWFYSRIKNQNNIRQIWYEDIIKTTQKMNKLKSFYKWIGIEGFDRDKIEEAFRIQLGTSTDEKLTGILPEGRKRK